MKTHNVILLFILQIIILIWHLNINNNEIITKQIFEISCPTEDMTAMCENIIHYCSILDHPNKIYYTEDQCIKNEYKEYLNNLSKYG
jgi:hypothetical protein